MNTDLRWIGVKSHLFVKYWEINVKIEEKNLKMDIESTWKDNR